MIEIAKGNLLNQKVEALVNTVNCVGVMGKGIALQFKNAFPNNYKLYEQACKKGDVQIGKMFVTATGSIFNPRFIINFPTKKHWKELSKLEYIREGLINLVEFVQTNEISSVALPPLGCGNGGLDWADVYPLIVSSFEELPNTNTYVFGPYIGNLK
jgi:O-acetyl-ADP-ribose deacetylase (regulator of RNase III)